MASVLSNYAGNLALSTICQGNLYLACHTDDPTATGILATEVSGGGYERQQITFSSPSTKTVVSTNAQTFTGMPVVTVTYFGVWDQLSAGHLLFSVQLTVSITTTASGQILCAPGDIAVSL